MSKPGTLWRSVVGVGPLLFKLPTAAARSGNCRYPRRFIEAVIFPPDEGGRQRSAGIMKGIILRAVTVVLGTMGYVAVGLALASVS
jgi:hypothetical protein